MMRTGAIVGRYLIGPQIGQGAFGKIFAARDSESGVLYAIKTEASTAERKTLAFETKILRRIQDSPYFPRIFDSGETGSLMWTVMELVGPSLSSIMKRRPIHSFSPSTAFRVARYSLLALEALHNSGLCIGTSNRGTSSCGCRRSPGSRRSA
jgi:serine/threonine protein kinase